MNQYKSSAELKDIAKEKLSGKYGAAMVVSPVLSYLFAFVMMLPLFMIILVPYITVSIINKTVPNEALLFVVILAIIFLCTILLGVLKTGIALFYLNIACGKRHSVSDIFYGFRWQFKKSLALSAISFLIGWLFLLPYYIFTFLNLYYYEPYWYPLAIISYLVGIIIYIPIQIALSQCFYLLMDFPQKSALELLKLSNQVMKGHKKRFFYLQLSFVPLQILSACSFNIGDLWLLPYQNMTYTLFFLDIMQPKQPTQAQYNPFE